MMMHAGLLTALINTLFCIYNSLEKHSTKKTSNNMSCSMLVLGSAIDVIEHHQLWLARGGGKS